MKDAKNINVSKNIMSNLLSMTVVGAIVFIIAATIVMAVFKFLWPTLKWLVPLSLFLIYIIFMLYEITKMKDDEARSHNQYKTTLVLTRTVLVLIIFLYDIESVAG